MKFDSVEFFPTPIGLLEKITDGLDWRLVNSVLEPSAGKGDMARYVMERHEEVTQRDDLDLDCVEIDSELQNVLTGSGFRVVHDDFMTFHTFKKYDLIIMNPPFGAGAAHLMKALDIQKDGGGVICVLKAETVRNPYTNEGKSLARRLTKLGADIRYMRGEFLSSERPTGVEIAVIKVFVPKRESESFIYDGLKKKYYPEGCRQGIFELAPGEFEDAIITMYNLEVESGISLIREYEAMRPHMLNDLCENAIYKKPILTMEIGKREPSVNDYVREVRMKYWNAVFRNPRYTGRMTSNLSRQYFERVEELADYDFSLYNIRRVREDMNRKLIKGIEDCVMGLFDELSRQYAYVDGMQNNIHYYNGWKTNKAWYINKKVILPFMNAYNRWNGRFDPSYNARVKLLDMEKALDYLDCGRTEGCDLSLCLKRAQESGQTRKIRLKYFLVSFYKKGTCHIEFMDEELLKKFNIFGCQRKKWLPPGYGKKTYQEMEPEERAVIDDFEGRESYGETVSNAPYYIYGTEESFSMIEDGQYTA